MDRIIIPKGHHTHEDTPSHYDVIQGGKRVRIFAIDIPNPTSRVDDELRQNIDTYLNQFFNPEPEEIRFQRVQ